MIVMMPPTMTPTEKLTPRTTSNRTPNATNWAQTYTVWNIVMTTMDTMRITCEWSWNLADRRSGIVIDLSISDRRLIRLAKKNQLNIENTDETAFQTELIPVEYPSPGSPTVMKPLLSDAFSLMDRTHGPILRPPRKYSEEPALLAFEYQNPTTSRNSRYNMTMTNMPVWPNVIHLLDYFFLSAHFPIFPSSLP